MQKVCFVNKSNLDQISPACGPFEALMGPNCTTMYQTIPMKASDGPEMAMGASVSVKKNL